MARQVVVFGWLLSSRRQGHLCGATKLMLLGLVFARFYVTDVNAVNAVNVPVPGPFPEDADEFLKWAEYPSQASEERPAGYEHAQHFWWHEINGTQRWDDPTLIRIADDGKETYIDPITGKATATKPVDAAWLTLWDDKSSMEYFHNTITKETTWHLPSALAWQKVHVDLEGNVVMPPEDSDEVDGDFWQDGEHADWEDGVEYEDVDENGDGHSSYDEGYHEENHEEDQAEADAMAEEQLHHSTAVPPAAAESHSDL